MVSEQFEGFRTRVCFQFFSSVLGTLFLINSLLSFLPIYCTAKGPSSCLKKKKKNRDQSVKRLRRKPARLRRKPARLRRNPVSGGKTFCNQKNLILILILLSLGWGFCLSKFDLCSFAGLLEFIENRKQHQKSVRNT